MSTTPSLFPPEPPQPGAVLLPGPDATPNRTASQPPHGPEATEVDRRVRPDGPPVTARVQRTKPAPTPTTEEAPEAFEPRGAADGKLVGIARLAAVSPLAREKRDTEYYLLPVRSILNRCDSPRMPFEWTINPYRGCEFGCRYCYARYTHEFMELEPSEFSTKIFAKENAGRLMARDLKAHLAALTAGGGQAEHIALGTATDPYQPAERDFGVTRAILEQLGKREGLSLSITTKSDQVVRDLDLLRRIHERSTLTINLSIITTRPRLARLLEPRAPRPDLRFAAIRKLREAGLHAGVFAMPVLPGLTDREADLDALARAARDARAEWLVGGVLWLMPSSRAQFLPFIEARFPKLARGYRKWYSRNAYAPQHYREEIALRVSAIRARYGLGARPSCSSTARPGPAPAPPQPTPAAQLSLALPAA